MGKTQLIKPTDNTVISKLVCEKPILMNKTSFNQELTFDKPDRKTRFMRVMKFGGASVKDAEAIKNVANILKVNSPNLVVISAIGKTTNHLETVVEDYFNQREYQDSIQRVKTFHQDILEQLFPDGNAEIWETFEKIFNYLSLYLTNSPDQDYDKVYDQIAPVGELLSSKILSAFLNQNGESNTWLDARKILRTDEYFRKANINWNESEKNLQEIIDPSALYITQGFIAGTNNNLMTTLGREGSDYSAAVFANMLNSESLTIWKDVPGVLNADPRYFNQPKKLDHLSYKEAIELSFYGATVIHPKTIKPLQNKGISLHVKSFIQPDSVGTLIDQETQHDSDLPIYIYKPNQVLISLSRKDFGFLEENQLSEVFRILHDNKLEVNIMQNSAINFSICVDNDRNRIEQIVPIFQEGFKVLYNTGLELLTVRHYSNSGVEELLQGHEVILEQKTRSTLKMLLRNLQE